MTKPETTFHWAIYADATAAGLSALIPVPGVDWLFEQFFRRRMPGSIAGRRRQSLAPQIIKTLNRGETNWLKSCLLLPFQGLYWLLKKISRKILYFLTVKEAVDQVSFYWHQAFLIDYMLLEGHLESEATTAAARRAMERVLRDIHRSPLRHLAWELVENTRHLGRSFLRALWRFRRGRDETLFEEKKSLLSRHWAEFTEYFENLATLYDQAYIAERRQQAAPELVTNSDIVS